MADVALLLNVRIHGRETRTPMLVLDMKHDIILGRKWFEDHDVLVDCKRRKISFPDTHPMAWSRLVHMDQAGKLLHPPGVQDTVDRRERLMTEEDKRRNDGRDSVRRRIQQLEAR